MRFKIGQTVYMLIWQESKICIEMMRIFKAEKIIKGDAIFYTGEFLPCQDGDEGYFCENNLYSTYEEALNKIEQRLQELKKNK